MDEDRIVDIVFIIGVVAVIVLKIIGVITIPWIWLLCPIWGLLIIGCAFAIIITLVCLIQEYINEKRKK